MARSSSPLLSQLKALINDFLDSDSITILSKPKSTYIKKELGLERINVIKDLIDLLLNTDFVSNETQLYIKNKYITYEGISEILLQEGKKIKPSAVSANVWYNKNKIVDTFGEGIVLDLVEYVDTDITSYKELIVDTKIKYSRNNVLDNVALKLPEASPTYSINETEYRDFITAILPYTKYHMEAVSEAIPKEAIGYAKWILSSSTLQGEHLQRKEELLELLGGDKP